MPHNSYSQSNMTLTNPLQNNGLNDILLQPGTGNMGQTDSVTKGSFLKLLDETGYFNASLYLPYGIKGIETLGHEIANELLRTEGKYPEAVVITNAGGGNLTGTARGLKDAGAINTKIIAASVNF